MAIDEPRSKMVVFDTETYAGNFERSFPAYVTGIGDTDYDRVRRVLSIPTNTSDSEWFEANCITEEGESGFDVYSTIYPTPGWYNDGFGNHYKESDISDEDAIIKRNEHLELKYSGTGASSWDMYQKWLDRPLTKHDAYMSIAIFVKEFPPDDVLDIMIARAKTFSLGLVEPNISFNITGVRLLEPIYKVDTVKTIEF
jgi:hypothetical protein